MGSFNNLLANAIKQKNSNVCIGLDIDLKKIPVKDPLDFNKKIITSTFEIACAYKPNLAFYEALGIPGLKLLLSTIQFIRDIDPEMIIIGDCKRGDIGPSAEAYSEAMFGYWNFDAITVNPWGGLETMIPYTLDASKGVFIWAKGSNPGSKDIQDLVTNQTQKRIYHEVATMAESLNKNENVGLVVGSNFPSEMKDLRDMCPVMPFLIPGIGAQGGDLESSVSPSLISNSPFLINSSRGIIYSSNGQDFSKAANLAALKLRDDINQVKKDLTQT